MKVDSNVLAANVVTKILPLHPRLARQAGIQGPVSLQVTVGTDGRIIALQPISGHPLLIPAAIDAARLWIYRPILLNGVPVEVVGQIEIKFASGEALLLHPTPSERYASPLLAWCEDDSEDANDCVRARPSEYPWRAAILGSRLPTGQRGAPSDARMAN
jgi:hypothetical protein